MSGPGPIHSAIGASSAHRWLVCPGSVRLERDCPPSRDSEASLYGSAGHALAERCLRDPEDRAEPFQFVGQKIKISKRPIDIDLDMADAVSVYVDRVRALGGYAERRIEQPFKLDWLDEAAYGTNDASVDDMERLHVLDLKLGLRPVAASGNSQTRYYLLGAATEGAQSLEDARSQVMGYRELISEIVQPRLPEAKDLPPNSETLSGPELWDWAMTVLAPGIQKTREADAPLVAGSHCRYCRASGRCPEQQAAGLAVARDVFGPVTSYEPLVPAVVANMVPAVSLLSPRQLGEAMLVLDKLEDWAKSVREAARQLLEKGVDVPHWKLVEGRRNRNWADETTAELALTEALGSKAWAPAKLASPAQAEKLLKSRGLKLNEELVAVQRGVSMVPVGDRRPALGASAADLFGDIE